MNKMVNLLTAAELLLTKTAFSLTVMKILMMILMMGRILIFLIDTVAVALSCGTTVNEDKVFVNSSSAAVNVYVLTADMGIIYVAINAGYNGAN